ncbi:MAG: hypothetical protein ACTS47_02550 [Candidatus Hodgkinia cicadicola]
MNDGTQARKRKLLAKFGKFLNEVNLRAKRVYTKILLKRWERRILTLICETKPLVLMNDGVGKFNEFCGC